MENDSSVNKLMVLLIMIVIFGGFSIAFTTHPLFKIHPSMRFVGLAVMLTGIFYLYYQYKTRERKRAEELKEREKAQAKLRRGRKVYTSVGKTKFEEEDKPRQPGMVQVFMAKIYDKSRGLSIYTFPIAGALIIDAVFMYNYFTGQGFNFESWDTITLLLGASLIAYNFVPEEFSVTRDFVVFFLGILFIILIFPQLFYSVVVGEEASANYTKVLLADPVVGILNTFGVESTSNVEFRTGGTYTAVITYALVDGGTDKVGITEACSGIYTTSIFISAFITYILVEYQKLDLRVAVILTLGVLASYLANILRMTIITGVGHYYGTEALLAAHQNAGWLIFLAWIIPFWYLVFRFLIKEDDEKENYGVPT